MCVPYSIKSNICCRSCEIIAIIQLQSPLRPHLLPHFSHQLHLQIVTQPQGTLCEWKTYLHEYLAIHELNPRYHIRTHPSSGGLQCRVSISGAEQRGVVHSSPSIPPPPPFHHCHLLLIWVQRWYNNYLSYGRSHHLQMAYFRKYTPLPYLGVGRAQMSILVIGRF